MKRLFILSCLLLCVISDTLAKTMSDTTHVQTKPDTAITQTIITNTNIRIYYPINVADVQENYMGNALTLRKIKDNLCTSDRIDSIVIFSYASPEGPYRTNERLARKRGESAKKYILSLLNENPELNFNPSLIRLNPTAENWNGLREEIIQNYHQADKELVLEILDSTLSSQQKKEQLMRLDNGRSWAHIKQELMPHLRYATWVTIWKSHPAETAIRYEHPDIKLEMPQMFTSKSVRIPTVTVDSTDTRTWLALKTNLLYDAISWLNFSIEAPLSDRFSVLYYHQFPWWRWGENRNEFCMRFLSIGAEGRWWFKPIPHEATESRIKRDRLTGWFAGVYLESGKWDFNRKRSICYQGEHWSTGLSIGYAMPIGKRLNLEFSLSAGYASIIHRGYEPSDDYSKLYHLPEKDGTWHYIGPTKAQISLVLPLVMKYKKGGRP